MRKKLNAFMAERKFVSFIISAAFAVVWVIPLLWVFFTTFKPEAEIQVLGFRFLPVKWTLINLIEVLSDTNSAPVFRWFLNSVVISTSHTAILLIVTSMAAYAYARLQFKGRDAIFWFLMGTMMFPSVINLVPLYKVMSLLDWVDTPMAVIVPGIGGVFNLFLIRQFMLGIPMDFDESAKIDGAGEWQVFGRIIVPLLRPILTVVGLLAFTASWNDFLWPTIAINDRFKMPLTAGLQLLQGVYDIEVAHLMASTLISILPTLLLFLAAQKYFLQGLNISSGVKG